jgi:mitochondrial enoyl-[acyl-carrier protein] reductase / trans-2-enoyl-CoA reductase
LNEPEHQILTLGASESDEVVTWKVQEVVAKILQGQYGRKVLLKFENPKE